MSAAADLVARSRAAQGLPERVTDPAALARVAAILAGALRDEGAPHHKGAPANTVSTTATSGRNGGRRDGT